MATNVTGGSMGGPAKGKKLRDALVPPIAGGFYSPIGGGGGGGQTNWKPPGSSTAATGVTGSPATGSDPSYWTPDRMRSAKPMGAYRDGGGPIKGGIAPPGGDLGGGGGQTNWTGGTASGGLGGGGTIGGGQMNKPIAGGFLSPGGAPSISSPIGGGGGMPTVVDGSMGGGQPGGQTNWMPPSTGAYQPSSPSTGSGFYSPIGGGGQTNWMGGGSQSLPALKLLAALFGGGQGY